MGNVKKTKTANVPTKSGGSYKYSYTDLAAINDYLESNDLTYDQFTQAFDTPNGLQDYIMTQRYRIEDQKLIEWGKPMRGLRIQYGNDTPQQLGARITYLRRYSLLMAFGLAAEDNDAQDVPPAQMDTPEPATAAVRSQYAERAKQAVDAYASKIDFNKIKADIEVIDDVESLEDYWRSLGNLTEKQAVFLQKLFAKRKEQINGVE